MDKPKVYLFTSAGCPHCPPAKRFIAEFMQERNDFELIHLVSGTYAASQKAKEFDVISVPTFIIQGPAIDYNIGAKGTPSKEAMNKYLDMALGTYKEKEKKPREFGIGRFKIKF